MSVRATFDYVPAEHYDAARAVTRTTSVRFIMYAMVGAAVGLFLWNVGRDWGDAPLWDLVWSGLPYLLLAVFWLFFLPLAQRRASKKLPSLDASTHGTQERIVDEVGYHSRGNGVALDIPWQAMFRVLETDRLFLFFYNKQCAYYIPKRALSAREIGEIRVLALNALGTRARLQQE